MESFASQDHILFPLIHWYRAATYIFQPPQRRYVGSEKAQPPSPGVFMQEVDARLTPTPMRPQGEIGFVRGRPWQVCCRNSISPGVLVGCVGTRLLLRRFIRTRWCSFCVWFDAQRSRTRPKTKRQRTISVQRQFIPSCNMSP